MTKVFIDGSSGTTGLRINERLSARNDIELIRLPEEHRKSPEHVAAAINESSISFLCLPDEAAREAVGFVKNPDTVILDTSTAHRTAPGWAYGFPELSEKHLQAVKSSKRIAVPGCHASGFIALVQPLISAGLIAPDTPLSAFSLTGYSGGGKKMIAQYQAQERDALLSAPRQYALGQTHKHLAEMTKITGAAMPPAFCPIVGDFYSGMEVTVPIFGKMLAPGAGIEDVKAVYRGLYTGAVVKYREGGDEDGFLSAAALSGRDCMEIGVFGNGERMLLTARYDNLGKGASGAAIECMNIVLGLDPTTGLEL